MSTVLHLLTGGFLAGYRTQIAGALVALTAVAHWLTGDLSSSGFLNELPTILGGLGLTALGAKVNTAATNAGVSVTPTK